MSKEKAGVPPAFLVSSEQKGGRFLYNLIVVWLIHRFTPQRVDLALFGHGITPQNFRGVHLLMIQKRGGVLMRFLMKNTTEGERFHCVARQVRG